MKHDTMQEDELESCEKMMKTWTEGDKVCRELQSILEYWQDFMTK